MECMVKGDWMGERRDREQAQKRSECRPRETEERWENVKEWGG